MNIPKEHNNLTKAMHYFGLLDKNSRELFLGMVQETKPKPKKKIQKPKIEKFSEEYFYQRLYETHNERVRKRLKRMEAKQKNHGDK